MTSEELNKVRELRSKIHALSNHLLALRRSADSIVPVVDGLPHSTEIKSRVEKLALKIVECEREISSASQQFAISALDLEDKISRADLNQQEKNILLMRYVACMDFQGIWLELKISDARTFHLHRTAVKNFLKSEVDNS